MGKVISLKGNWPKVLTNATLYGAESVIFDLVDTVIPQDKDIARILLKEAFSVLDYSTIKTIVRINSIEAGEGIKDLTCFTSNAPDSFIIPIQDKESLTIALDAVQKLETFLGIEIGGINLYADVKTAKAYEYVKESLQDSGFNGIYIDTDKVIEDLKVTDGNEKFSDFLTYTLEISCKAKGLILINAKEVACY